MGYYHVKGFSNTFLLKVVQKNLLRGWVAVVWGGLIPSYCSNISTLQIFRHVATRFEPFFSSEYNFVSLTWFMLP